MEPLLQQLLQSPKLELYFSRIRDRLEQEHEQRQRFYEQVSEGDKAEFINGKAIVHSPVRRQHSQASQRTFMLLSSFVQARGLGWVGHEKVMISLTRNDYEPDVVVFGKDAAQGFAFDQLRYPAPNLVVEVLSNSTALTDRGIKMEDYAAHGVQEYWLIDPQLEIVEQYGLSGSEFQLVMKAKDGTLTSLSVPGFQAPVRALFDDVEQMACLRRFLQEPPPPSHS